MTLKLKEPVETGRLVNISRTHPVVEVDCSTWESDIPESAWSTGKLVNVVRAEPPHDLGKLQEPVQRARAVSRGTIQPQELAQFLRRYRFPGGRVRAVRIRNSSEKNVAVEFRLAVRTAIKDLGAEPKPVRLKLRVVGVEEFRVQMRPNMAKVKIADARIAFLNGLFYVTFDALGLGPSERAEVYDFRASELFAAGRELEWEEVT